MSALQRAYEYEVGRVVTNTPQHGAAHWTWMRGCARVFHLSSSRARSATLYWMWMRKVHKDLLPVIGKLIYASRNNPELWHVSAVLK